MRHWIFFFCVALMMTGCATQKQQHEHQTHVITVDTLVTETQIDSHSQQHRQDIDSLGRVVRQQQRTTDRTVSRQELQRQEQQIQEMKTSLQRHIEMQDSAWAAKFSQLETHLKDSLDQTIDKQSVTNAAPVTSWWKQLWRKFELIMTGMIFATALFVTRKFWIPWLKRLF